MNGNRKNKAIVIRFNKEFFESGNTEVTKELLDDTFINHTAPTDVSIMIKFTTGFHQAFSNVSVEIREVNKVSLRKNY